jgi:predicted ArsR family transcriptional regulator
MGGIGMSAANRKLSSPDPRGAYQRGRILTAIANEPLTAQQLADKLHLTKDAINLHLRVMKEASPRLVHIAGYVYNPDGGRPAPQYRPGDHKDAVYVRTRHILQGRKEVVDKTIQRVIELLQRKPMTAKELGDTLDLAPARARWYINHLRTSEPKRVYVKRFSPNFAGYPAPVYAAGNKPDAVYTPKTPKQVHQDAMRDPERRQRILARSKLRHFIESKRKKPNGIFGELGI